MTDVFISPSSQWSNQYAGGATGVEDSEGKHMRDIAPITHKLLLANGIDSHLSMDTDLWTRIQQSNAMMPKLHYAMHSNASGTSYGAGTYIYQRGTLSEVMANKVQARLAALTPWPDNGVIVMNHYETRTTKAYAVIAEIAFHDKSVPAEWIRTHKRELAIAQAQGIIDALAAAYGGKYADIAARPLMLGGGGGTSPVVVPTIPKPKPVTGEWPDVDLWVDGALGPVTIKAWQRLMASIGKYEGRIDGIFGPVTARAMQSWLRGLSFYGGWIDGHFGPLSVKGLQSFLRSKGLYTGYIDGMRGPLTVKAEQQYLNDQRQYQ